MGSFPENDSTSLGRTKEDDLCVGVETCRGLTGGILVDDGEALVTFPSLLFSLLRGRDAALHVLPRPEPRCHRRERRYANQSRELHPCVPSPEGEGQEEGMGTDLVGVGSQN
jgi:hypothetical protein